MILFDCCRSIFSICIVLCCFAPSCAPALAAPAPETFQLQAARKIGELLRVRALLKVDGKLQIKSADDKIYEPPVQVTSKLYYDEKTLNPVNDSQGNKRAVRYYYLAEAEIGIDQKTTSPSLSPERRTMVHILGEQRAFFADQGPLTRDELDLVDIPGDTLSLEELLPVGKVHIGQKWSQNGYVLKRWLGLDDVGHAEVSSRLVLVKDGLAHVEMKGHLTGMASGVETDIELVVKYRFDLTKHHITQLVMDIQEKRATGHAKPGLEVLARLQLRMTPIQSSEPLDSAELAHYNVQETAGARLLRFQSQRGGFSTLHDSRWHVILDNDKTTMLRLVDNGDLIAQCNIARLSDLEHGKTLPLHNFQADIRKALGDNFSEFVEADETELESGLHTTRVVTVGTVGKLTIRWTYYQLTNAQGERATCVFTFESGTEERFAAADETIIQSFAFLIEATANQSPTPVFGTPESARTENVARRR